MEIRNIVAIAVLATSSLLGTHAAQAAVSTQTKSFNIASGPFSSGGGGSQPLTVFDGTLSGTFNPFDASLGVLDSFKITWDVTHSAKGTVGTEAGSTGAIGFGGGATVSVNNNLYNGGGGNVSAAGQLGDVLNPSFTTLVTNTFLVSNAGVTYDPAILGIVKGANTFELKLRESVNGSYTRVVDLSTLLDGSVTLEYNFTPSAVPEPSSWLMLAGGLAALGAMRRRQQRRTATPA